MTLRGFLGECYAHRVIYGPSNRFFSDLRWKHYRGRLREGSRRFASLTGLSIPCPARVRIGEDVSFNEFVLIDACDGGEITIGHHCLIGPFVLLRSADHEFRDPVTRINLQGHRGGRVVLEEDCWIGGHTTITRDVTIGKGSVIGANSVVTRDIPPFSVAAGNPARVIGARDGKAREDG